MGQKIDMDFVLAEVAKSLGPVIQGLFSDFGKKIDEKIAVQAKAASDQFQASIRGLQEDLAGARKQAEDLAGQIAAHVRACSAEMKSFQEQLGVVSTSASSNLLEISKVHEQVRVETEERLSSTKATNALIGARLQDLEDQISEVKDLAESSSKAATESLVKISATVDDLRETFADRLNGVNSDSAKTSEHVEALATASKQQATKINELSKAVSEATRFAEGVADASAKNYLELVNTNSQMSEDVQRLIWDTKKEIAGNIEGLRVSAGEAVFAVKEELQQRVASFTSSMGELREWVRSHVQESVAGATNGQDRAIREFVEDTTKKLKDEFENDFEFSKQHDVETAERIQHLESLLDEVKNLGDAIKLRATTSELQDLKNAIAEQIEVCKGVSKVSAQELQIQLEAVSKHLQEVVDTSAEWIKQVEKEASAAVEKARVASSEAGVASKAVAELADQFGKSTAEVNTSLKTISDSIAQVNDAHGELAEQLRSSMESVPGRIEDARVTVEMYFKAALTGVASRITSVENEVKKVDEKVADIKMPDVAAAVHDQMQAARPGIVEEVGEALQSQVDAARAETKIFLVEELRREVARIPAPKDGKDGADGRDGKDGADGQMPRIRAYAPGMAYPERSVVAALGGLWQARCDTSEAPAPGAADWAPLSVGMAELGFETSEDGREVHMSVKLSDGTVQKSIIELPVSVWQDTYSSDKSYRKADEVTHGGSVWHAMKAGILGVPGKCADWKLKVKCGRDGKDGKDIVRHVGEIYGEWEMDKLYKQYSIVTHAGVHWMAKHDTNSRPPWAALRSNETWLKMGD